MLSLLAVTLLAQNLPLPPLPYDYEALEPHIDAATMRVHHLKHHQTYTDKINGALTKLRSDPQQKHLAKLGVDKLLQHLGEIEDKKVRRIVQNAGGGYVNHDFFFRCMAPDGGGEPSDALGQALAGAFGSVDIFKQLFMAAALEVFGSGWAWLVFDTAKSALSITSTANQDTPAMEAGMVPLLGLDVWEHAYYLKHQSNRKGYVESFFEVVSWAEVARRLDTAKSADGGKKEL
jgi:Fe-Mn family superoxide dismutase